jgi:hypothetical protein
MPRRWIRQLDFWRLTRLATQTIQAICINQDGEKVTNIIQVDDKELMKEAVQAALTQGEKFAKKLFDILIEDWGADKYQIDQISLIEMGTGHLIDCCMRGVPPTPYREYIADCLEAYSDIGLAKMGLTRAQYRDSLRAVAT